MNIESKIKKDVSLAPMTTFKIGGTAEYYLEVEAKDELREAIAWAKGKKLKYFILAGGSNVLISDQGVKGLIIKLRNNSCTVKGRRIVCGAGTALAKAVSSATSYNLSGLEWAAGIPGSIGGSIRGNAGAFGQDMDEIIENVEVFDIGKEKFELFSKNDCKFNYRDSIFKKNNKLVIWQAIIKLKPGKAEDIKDIINQHINYREQTQPRLPSAGCIFKNFKVVGMKKNSQKLAELARQEKIIKKEKIGAGWLIAKAGLKGKTIGGAKVSLEHANFIVNTKNATAEDVIMLISYIKQQVRDKYNVQLQEEIEYFGFG